MTERKRNIEAVEIDYVCDVCRQGTMRPTGKTLRCYPPKYPHKCLACDYEANLSRMYPEIIYK